MTRTARRLGLAILAVAAGAAILSSLVGPVAAQFFDERFPFDTRRIFGPPGFSPAPRRRARPRRTTPPISTL
jgi:hypothetical protein